MSNGKDVFRGEVRNQNFVVAEPKNLQGQTLRLTTLKRQAAEAPDQRLLDLSRYEGQSVTVRGYLNGDFIFEAEIDANAE